MVCRKTWPPKTLDSRFVLENSHSPQGERGGSYFFDHSSETSYVETYLMIAKGILRCMLLHGWSLAFSILLVVHTGMQGLAC